MMINNKEDIDSIMESISELIYYQIFDDGNNQTISAFFRIYIKSFLKATDDEYYINLMNRFIQNESRNR